MSLQIASFDAELVRLIQEKCRDEVISIIENRNLYDIIDIKVNSLLHISIQSKNTEVAKYLIDSGSLIDLQNHQGQTPLMLAIENDCQELIELLVEADANLYLKNSFGKSALEMIGKYERASEKVLRLLSQKLQVDCSNAKEVIVQKLSDANWTLHNVVGLRDAIVTKMMLHRGLASSINALNSYKQSALHVAVKYSDDENVKVLLENNASVNVVDSRQRIPLSYVYYHNNHDYEKERLNIIRMLLDRETLRVHPESLRAALDILEFGSREAIKLLLQNDVNFFATDSIRLTVILALLANKDPIAIEELRGKGYHVDLSDGDGTVVLMKAASRGVGTVEFLIKNVTDVYYDDVGGYKTTLLLAAVLLYCVAAESQDQYKQCVQLLLECGANVQMEIPYRRKSYTILDVILEKEYLLLGELVLEHMALKEAVGEPVDAVNLARINSSSELFDKFNSSKLQLSMEIYESINLLDLLTANEMVLRGYTNKEEFDSKIQGVFNVLKDYYYYFWALLQKRLRNLELKMKAVRFISWIMKMNYDSFPRIADDIVSYLDFEDLENLSNASL